MDKKNVLIRASAGTGKTFSLATRCLWLLSVKNVKPETIVALTFSRAAAQEIYAAILKRLWKAAANDEKAREEAKRLDAPALTRGDFIRVLKRLVESQSVGNIATIDSFILKLVCNYPLELGFQNAVAVIDDFEKGKGLDAASGKYLESENKANDADLQSFISSFTACMKKDWPREIRSTLSALMGSDLRNYIVGRKLSDLPSEAEMLAALDLTDVPSFDAVPPESEGISFPCEPSDAKVEEAFGDFKERVRNFTCEEMLGYEKKAKSGQAIKGFWNLFRGESNNNVLSYTKKVKGEDVAVSVALSAEVANAVRSDISRADKLFLVEKVKEAAHQLTVLKAIEKNYDFDMRRAGKLTFTDLADFHEEIPFDQRLNIEYRFDLKFNHWALDEFQDTSCAQWGCLESLVDNAAQDDEKSVMTVGDLKQAIYGWRGGSKAPFANVVRWCGQGAEQWTDKDLKFSFRYQKNICDFVNAIFNEKYLASQNLFSASEGNDVPSDWLLPQFWKNHEAERRSDAVRVVGVDPKAPIEEVEGLKDDATDIMKRLAKPILDEVEACWRKKRKPGESVGILVRERRFGLAIAAILRAKGLPVVWEGKRGIRDTPLVELFLSPIVLAEHPETSIAWELLRRSTLADSLPTDWTSAEVVSRLMSRSLATEGLARTLQGYLKNFPSCEELTAVVREAVKFENQGAHDGGVDAFLAYLDSVQNSDVSSGTNEIRIMTIHRSKGLTLHHVFVPLFETDKSNLFQMAKPPRCAVLLAGEYNGKNWVLPHVTGKMSGCHAALKKAWQRKKNEYVSEVLNLYYVALTRARQSVTVILPRDVQGVSSLITGVLPTDGRWQNEGVYEVLPTEPPKSDGDAEESVKPQGFAIRPDATEDDEYKRVSPSGEFRGKSIDQAKGGGASMVVKNPFAEDFGSDAQAGIEKHVELEKEDWRNPKEENRWAAPADGWTEIWQEKAFEFVEEKVWISGKIDRVTFYPDGRVVIADYKFSDKTDDELRAAYASQLQTYARAVRKLTGQTNISAQLLVSSSSTCHHRVIDINLI